MRLLGVELRRLTSRPLILVTALLALGGVLLITLAIWLSTQPLTEAQLAEAEERYQAELQYVEEEGEAMVAQCLEDEAREREALGDDVPDDQVIDWDCESRAEPPQRDWFFPQDPSLSETLPTFLSLMASFAVVLAFGIGVTSTAAEMRSGSMSSWLTFIPRRGRVLTSKVVAAALSGLVLTLVLLVVFVAGLWVAHASRDLVDGMTGEVWAEGGWMLARILAVATIAGAVGAAIGVLVRHTAVVMGIVVAYVVVVEGVIGSVVRRTQPWLLSTNMTGVVENGTSYGVETCVVEAGGTMCEWVEVPISLTHSSIYLGVLSVVALVVTALVFRWRDVG